MNVHIKLFSCFFFLYFNQIKTSLTIDAFAEMLIRAEKLADLAMDDIFKEWQIDQFPNFLKSCSMSKHSWDFMKLKFRNRILKVAKHGKITSDFKICFGGSSVTAGHDTPFNKSVAAITQQILGPVFSALNISVNVYSAALGNNPCFPYDICMKTYCGEDADIVHWEQSYFCGFNRDHAPTLEQFVRQSMGMNSHPIIVFSDSSTPNWVEKDCPKPIVPYQVTDADKDMLASSPFKLATEINKDEHWGGLYLALAKAYRSAGLQTWKHHHYSGKYNCQGPYHKDFGVGTVSWHPSVDGHRLRAAHHAYFWIGAWREVTADLLRAVSGPTPHSLRSLLNDTERHIEKLVVTHPIPVKPLYFTNVSDNIQCYTDFEPKADRNMGLSNITISGLNEVNGWFPMVLEEMLPSWNKLSVLHRKQGYPDFKHILVANGTTIPLSLSVTVTKNAPIYICEPTSFMGKTASIADHIWNLKPKIFMTLHVKNNETFLFSSDMERTLLLDYFHVTATGGQSGEICIQTMVGVEAGHHVLTIVPTHKEKILMLAHVMIP